MPKTLIFHNGSVFFRSQLSLLRAKHEVLHSRISKISANTETDASRRDRFSQAITSISPLHSGSFYLTMPLNSSRLPMRHA